MADIKRKVPNLRFKGFTDDWEQRKLRKVACINPKTNIPDNFKYVDLESVVGTSLIKAKLTTKQLAPSRAQRVAKKGDIFYQTVRPYQKNNFLFDINNYDFQYVFSTGYAQLRSEINNYFLFSYLQRQRFVNLILRRSTGTSYPAISSKDLSEIKIIFPRNSKEQENIGKIINLIDALITLQQRKLDLLKQLKKGLLQKMFAEKNSKQPVLRFKGFHDDWEQRKLGDALEEFSYGLNTPATKFDGKNKYLRITDIDDDTHAFNQTSLTSPKDKDDNYILGQGDILFARTGASVGKTYMYKANDGKVYYAGFLIKGHIKNGFSTEFIFNTTRLPQYQNFVKVTSMRSGQPGINAKEYQNYVIYVPVKQEQERIGQLISKLDTLITLHQRKQNHLKLLKKSLLQQMFM